MTSKVGLIPLPFNGGYYRSQSRAFNDKRVVNWFVNYPEELGINEYQLLPCAGIRAIEAYLGTSPNIRGVHIMNGKLYAVVEGRLFRIDYTAGAFSVTDLTTPPNFINGSGRVIMAAIKNQLVIVAPGVSGHLYTDGGSLVQISAADFLTPNYVVAIDSYFVFSQTGTNTIFSSGINQGSVYNALDRYIVSQCQVVVGLTVYRNQLYVMGDKNIVPFYNAAALQFAFRPIQNAALDYGQENIYLSANVKDAFVFVGRSKNSKLSVWSYSSGLPKKISTGPIDRLLNKCTVSELASAFITHYADENSECLSLTFYNGANGYTFVYDFTASERAGFPHWHERTTFIDGFEFPWEVTHAINCYGLNIVFRSGSDVTMGVLDDSIGTEYGRIVRRHLNTQPYLMMGVNTKVSSLEIYTDIGVDNNSQLVISWSDDGGFNYGNKLPRSTGPIGDYGRRVVWNNLGGFSRQRMLQLEYTGAYPRAINKIMANVA